ncbi:hypothetical protein [uncultured Brachyspira sp.]|uniref:mannitol dehydrogenase family protein n=1 Tax=uncultured Brachyspira sp. TaxID=221953 RepID=UPI0025F352BC|nr:hypothetical protein [uncultured Brachyspira sp.]
MIPHLDICFLTIKIKLFTLNIGHAITVYLGFINNKKTVYESINDENIKDIVLEAMIESGAVLIKSHVFERR